MLRYSLLIVMVATSSALPFLPLYHVRPSIFSHRHSRTPTEPRVLLWAERKKIDTKGEIHLYVTQIWTMKNTHVCWRIFAVNISGLYRITPVFWKWEWLAADFISSNVGWSGSDVSICPTGDVYTSAGQVMSAHYPEASALVQRHASYSCLYLPEEFSEGLSVIISAALPRTGRICDAIPQESL